MISEWHLTLKQPDGAALHINGNDIIEVRVKREPLAVDQSDITFPGSPSLEEWRFGDATTQSR